MTVNATTPVAGSAHEGLGEAFDARDIRSRSGSRRSMSFGAIDRRAQAWPRATPGAMRDSEHDTRPAGPAPAPRSDSLNASAWNLPIDSQSQRVRRRRRHGQPPFLDRPTVSRMFRSHVFIGLLRDDRSVVAFFSSLRADAMRRERDGCCFRRPAHAARASAKPATRSRAR